MERVVAMSLRSFLHRNLDPAARLGEVLFGLIMALVTIVLGG